MRHDASELSRRLARDSEAVCRHYLSNGRRQGRYWTVGDARNTPGRSMFVRLTGPEAGPGAAGHWTDAATGEHGDLLDVIGAALGLSEFGAVAEEARRFLSLPRPALVKPESRRQQEPTVSGSAQAARRLYAMAKPIGGTIAETYLRARGVTVPGGLSALRFHPNCFYRPEGGGTTQRLPAIVAAVTDLDGRQTGAHRTWLAPDGSDKAAVATPRRAMGDLLGHGVRFGRPRDVLVTGEGIETVLSVRSALPRIPALAALSAVHLGAILFPAGLRRLYVLQDRDAAGEGARETLTTRATEAGIEVVSLMPVSGDFNDDLMASGVDALRQRLVPRLHPQDGERFLAR